MRRRSAKALMYQSGYLTIKGLSKTEVDEIGNPKLILGAPNHEVRGVIREGWFDSIVKVPSTEFDALVDVAKRQVAAGDVRCLVGETLYRIYAKIPPEWKIRSEADVKRYFRLFMEMLGAKVAAEVRYLNKFFGIFAFFEAKSGAVFPVETGRVPCREKRCPLYGLLTTPVEIFRVTARTGCPALETPDCGFSPKKRQYAVF